MVGSPPTDLEECAAHGRIHLSSSFWSRVVCVRIAALDADLAGFHRAGAAAAVASTPRRRSARSRRQVRPADRTVLPTATARGHFQVDARIDGRPIELIVDTGASLVVINESSAARLGIFPRPPTTPAASQTANGVAKFAPVRLNRIEVNGITVHDVQAAVMPDSMLSVNLLGMSFLSRVKWSPRSRPAGARAIAFSSSFCAIERDGPVATAFPSHPALSYGCCAGLLAPFRGFDVSQAQAVADPQHLCLRVRAAGEADRLPRVRRALAAGQGNQPDGRAGAGHGARHADPRARREAGDRHRP